VTPYFEKSSKNSTYAGELAAPLSLAPELLLVAPLFELGEPELLELLDVQVLLPPLDEGSEQLSPQIAPAMQQFDAHCSSAVHVSPTLLPSEHAADAMKADRPRNETRRTARNNSASSTRRKNPHRRRYQSTPVRCKPVPH
jgi:hypothetical protein